MNLELDPRYQTKMHDWLFDHDRAAAFVGIGLGKTATTLSAFRSLMTEGAARAMLVVAPMRVANMTWPNEIRKWDQFRQFRVEKLRDNNDRPSGKATIYLTNYERLPKIRDLSFCDTIVFDELTKAKSHQSERIDYIRALMRGGYRRWGLTGTPRPNGLHELYGQVKLLDDGKRLGVSNHHFRQTYFEENPYTHKLVPREGAKDTIYRLIHDLAITLRSSDYLDIPETIEEDVEVALPPKVNKIYRDLERDLMVLIDSNEVVAVNGGVLVNKLLQVCGGAVYANPEDRTVVNLHDAKIKALQKMLTGELENEPSLIACNFIHERERICAAVPGAVDAHKFKGDIEDAWNSGRIKYLVADPRGLGHGLNLQQGGRNVVWFSPCWSRELYDQFNGRVARRGQDEITRIYRIICPGTMDDCVIEALRTRGDEQSEMMAVLTAFREQGLTFSLAA